ncbi:MAG: NAD-dependent epimerase/dehydratase family protein [Treponema sp.]|nr:NAD-dependent epimerase/dehydratase family protein [Treponema sp.]
MLTSAFGAIGVGHKNHQEPYTENDWMNTEVKIHPYQKSKTLAEKAAWNFIATEGKDIELAAVNPVGIMGPIYGKDYSHSMKIIRQMLDGEIKAVAKILSGYVDVRDVADLHILATTKPDAKGERFLATTGETLSMLDVATILRQNLGEKAAKVPTKELPNFIIRLTAIFNPSLRIIATLLGQNMQPVILKQKSC